MAKPRYRFPIKAVADEHGIRVPDDLRRTAVECAPLPFVLSPVDSGRLEHLKNVQEFERLYGNLMRCTPEYHGLERRALRSALSKRTCIHLTNDEPKWVADPILVSDWCLRQWLVMYDNEVTQGRDDIELLMHFLDRAPRALREEYTYGDVEDWFGDTLRRSRALGFTGYRAVEGFLRERGLRVCQGAIRKWYDAQSRWTPYDVQVHVEEAGDEWCAGPCLTYADLNSSLTWLHRRRYVHGASIAAICEGLLAFRDDRKNVSRITVRDWFRDNPLRIVKCWQMMLQESIIQHLVELKREFHGETEGPQWAADWRCITTKSEGNVVAQYSDEDHQSFFKQKLWAEFAVRCDFKTADLCKVWPHICTDGPHMAAFCCAICGYSFPQSQVIIRQGRKKLSEDAYVWDCEGCVRDGGIAEEAAVRGYRTRWSPALSVEGHCKWGARCEQYDGAHASGVWLGSESFKKSLAALYERRTVAQGLNLKVLGLNRYDAATDLAKSKFKRPPDWEHKNRLSCEIHDELFYSHGYDVPMPRFLHNAGRAAYLRLSESQLLPWHRTEEHQVNQAKRKHEDAALQQSCHQRLQGNDPAKKVCYSDLRKEMDLAAKFARTPPPPGYTFTQWHSRRAALQSELEERTASLGRDPTRAEKDELYAEWERHRQELIAGGAGA